MMRGISERAVSIIDSVQPYREKEPRKSPLLRLHYLNNADKHRLLMVTCGVIAQPRLTIDPGEKDVEVILPDARTATFRTPTEEGTEILKVTIRGHSPSTKIHAEVVGQLAFEQLGSEEFVFVIPGLKQLRDATVATLGNLKRNLTSKPLFHPLNPPLVIPPM